MPCCRRRSAGDPLSRSWKRFATGVYGDVEFIIDRVDALHRIVHTRIELLGDYRKIALFADDVVRV